jgi:single-strand DNA-binding protein
MPSYNKVILMGNLTRDPELRYTPSGQAVADFRIAINRRSRTPEGERRDSTTFVDVTAWGRQAELINEYFSKGSSILLDGRLSLDEWTGDDGQRRSKLRVVLEAFQFVTPRGQTRAAAPPPGEPAPPPGEPAPPAAPPRGEAAPPPQRQAPPQAEEAEPFDDVPF